MPNPLVETIRQIITPAIEGLAYELVDVEWKHEQLGWIVRVFIDGPGGISHDDCERVSRELSAVLDVSDAIPHAYHLEVSSPGLDRPLRTLEHFRRFVGQRAKVRLKAGVDGRRNFSGTIVRVGESDVSVEVDGKEYTLPIGDLDKANLDWQLAKPEKHQR